MGVPTSGSLSLRNIARERYYGSYGGGGSITGPVSMYDMLNGGNAGGGLNYPPLNVECGNVSPNGEMSSWYGYCQNWVCYYGSYSGYEYISTRFDPCNSPGGPGWSGPFNYYANEECTDFTDPVNNGWTVNSTILYDGNGQPCSGGTVTPYASVKLVVYFAGGANPNVWVTTNASGVITSINICP
tara:strand:+ start:34 stop:588 length:555 start_codon:yes stop_codon:yes gene_type:complete